MRIDELIEKLEEVKNRYGNLKVKMYTYDNIVTYENLLEEVKGFDIFEEHDELILREYSQDEEWNAI